MSHIFVSYSRKNADVAKDIVDRLRIAGYAVWQDITAIKGGEKWRKAIQRGIREVAAFVVIWSKPASESTIIAEEIALAKLREDKDTSFHLVPLCLDDTELSDDLTLNNAIFLQDGVDVALKKLVDLLPKDIRRVLLGFDASMSLASHDSAAQVRNTPWMTVPLLQSEYCKAYVFGKPEFVFGEGKAPERIQLCLQFFRGRDELLPAAHETLEHLASEGETIEVAGLYITGPYDTLKEQYFIDNDNPAQWLEAIYTIDAALKELRGGTYPRLQVFALAPGALLIALGTHYYRFWNMEIYNFISPKATPKYKKVMELG